MTDSASHQNAASASILTGWPAAASARASVEQAAEAVSSLLRLARGMAVAGRRVDLAGLDRMIGLLCARCLDLPPKEGQQMSLLLAGLLVEIDALGAEVTKLPSAGGSDSTD